MFTHYDIHPCEFSWKLQAPSTLSMFCEPLYHPHTSLCALTIQEFTPIMHVEATHTNLVVQSRSQHLDFLLW